jgi:hypothetical protein
MQPRQQTWTPVRIFVWGIIAVLAGWHTGPSFVRLFYPSYQYVDFSQEWLSARNLTQGLPAYMPYLEALSLHTGSPVKAKAGAMNWNAHPPTSVLLALPVAGFDYPRAQSIWNLAMIPAFVLSFLLLGVRLSLPPSAIRYPLSAQDDGGQRRGLWDGLPGLTFSPWVLLPASVLLLYCDPLRVQIFHGQLNLLLLLLILLCWALDRSGRPGWAGAVLGAATAIKLFPGFLFLYFVCRRQWRSVLAGAISAVVLTGITLLVEGADAYRTYLTKAVPSLEQFQSFWLNDSVLGFWMRMFDPSETALVSPLHRAPWLARSGAALTNLLLVAVLIPIVWRARSRRQCDSAFALCITAMLLVSPIAWSHYFVLLLLPIAWLWLELPSRGVARWVFRAVLLLVWLPPGWIFYLLMRVPLSARLDRVPPATPMQNLTVLNLSFYALLLLFLLGLFDARAAAHREVAEYSLES